MRIAIISLLTLVFAVLSVRTSDKGPRFLAYAVRPLTMLLIIGLVLEAGEATFASYKAAILAGLLFSLAGDIFMMLRKKRFTEGLACFLIALIIYTGAFLYGIGLRFLLWPTIPLLVYAALMLWILYPRLGKMRIPILIYILVIITMTRVAMERYLQIHNTAALAGALGAGLFLISDSVLAFNRFIKPFHSAQTIILSTYFCAQWLIALSAVL